MTPPATNRYAAPQAEVSDAAAQGVAATSSGLPVTLLLRWLLAIALVVLGLWRTLVLISNWRFFTDSMIIEPLYNPWPLLAMELCVLAAGVLLGRRSQWVFLPVLLHVVLFARQTLADRSGLGVSWLSYQVWAAELLVFGFCAWLWLRRGLK